MAGDDEKAVREVPLTLPLPQHQRRPTQDLVWTHGKSVPGAGSEIRGAIAVGRSASTPPW